MPGWRRRGALQERVPRHLLGPPWLADARPHDRSREARRPAAASRRCRTSSRRAPPAGGSTSSCSGSIGAGRRPPTRAKPSRDDSRAVSAAGFPASPSRQPPAAGPRVVLFNDTFTNYNHPEIGVAAAFLDAAGHTPHLVPHGCCGRPLISQGLLDEARVAAHALTDALHDTRRSRRPDPLPRAELLGGARGRAGAAARRAAAGSGCRHGVHAVRGLRRGGMAPRPDQRCAATGAVNRPAARPLSSESDGPDAVRTRARGARAVVHGRRSRRGMLGMAGSFGYAKEHYEVSRQIGERKLLPVGVPWPRTQCLAAGTRAGSR